MHIFLLCESSSNSVPQMLHNMLDEARQLTHTRISEGNVVHELFNGLNDYACMHHSAVMQAGFLCFYSSQSNFSHCLFADPAEMAVIIEGDALAAALEENNRTTFLQLCRKCRTVLCCRVSPLQKALVRANALKTYRFSSYCAKCK